MEAARTSGKSAFEFTGDGETYFGIWIQNLLLTIITVGFYSPWAKVRRLRYFYGNTLVDGSPFEFHGKPLALLRGRLIGLALLLAYTQASKVSLELWLSVVVVLAAGMPWLLWKSLQFRLANSSYRGIRLGFDGTLAQAYTVFGLPIALFLAPNAWMLFSMSKLQPGQTPTAAMFLPIAIGFPLLALLAPWFYLRLKRYQHGTARLGTTPFAFSGTAMGAYGLVFAMLGLGLLSTIAALILGGSFGYLVHLIASATSAVSPVPAGGTARMAANAGQAVAIFAGTALGYAVMLSVYPMVAALRQNFVWRGTSLGDAPFESGAEPLALLRLSAVNAFYIIITLGFYWPYAVVRTLRYQVGALAWTGDPARFQHAATDGAVSAAGEEATELLGFDLAL